MAAVDENSTAQRATEQTDEPDIMNDPSYNTNSAGTQRGLDDPDTCRICRGEGSKDEPLFYPCKCSGSIKFVHQSCLMEWLSHSQKKHCELCKIPFHFTKLYSPHMPATVPLLVFLRQAAVHSYGNLITWSRFQLVFLVWIAWLPWSMRSIWRGLFWFGDGGWIVWQEAQRRAQTAAQEHLDKLAAEGTTPAGNFFASREFAAGAMVSRMANAVPQILSPISSTLDYSGGPILFRLGRRLLRAMIGAVGNQTKEAVPPLPPLNHTITPAFEPYSSSLLSDVKFLRTLTRFPTMNRVIVDMLEGQIITLSVVIVFILTFLIREWVVQQRPGINLAAADAGNREAGNVPALQQLARQHAEQHLPQAQEALRAVDNVEDRHPGNERRPRILPRPPHERRQHPLAQVTYAEIDETEEARDSAPTDTWSETATTGDEDHRIDSSTDDDSSSAQQRPTMPERNSSRQAAEIRRVLEEQSRASGQQDWPGLKIFMDLWTRAQREPSEVIRIIDQEGRNQELGWIIAFMRRLEKIPNTQQVPSLERDVNTTTNTEDDTIGIHDTDNPIHPPASEETHKSSISPPTPNTNGFWPSIGLQESSGEDGNGPRLRSNPSSSIKNTVEGVALDSESLGLRDISNQQVGRGSSGPRSSHSHVMDNSDSESDMVMVQSHTENISTPSSSTLNTPPEECKDNPFHPDYIADLEPTRTTDESSAQEMFEHLEEQNQTTRLPEEGSIILHDVPNPDEATDVDDVQGDSAPVPSAGSQAAQGYADLLMNWLWGEVPPSTEQGQFQDRDEERVVDNIEEEAPFVPVAHGQPVIEDANDQGAPEPGQDADVRAAAIQAGLDPNDVEAVEDAEDLEGIMELVGMQGPIVGLVQNGMFCAVIVSLTIFFGVWIPYIAGKFFLVFLANPVSLLVKMPLRWASGFADFTIDALIFSAGCSFYWMDIVARFLCSPVGLLIPPLRRISQNSLLAETAKGYAESALDRLFKGFMLSSGSFLESDIPTFSVIAHESLQDIQQRSRSAVEVVLDHIVQIVNTTSVIESLRNLLTAIVKLKTSIATLICSILPTSSDLKTMSQSLASINPLKVDLSTSPRTTPLDYSLSIWGTKDRAVAVLLGYLAFGLIGIAYLKTSGLLRSKNAAGKVEGPAADILYQAGGVLKVVLIISIEMIVFPLFCGLLLDVALLPLFGNASLLSRINFSVMSPWTSLFIHWFVGTCYMFHLALFVSMCRKIMRTGVLYFIRDPDDPTFHPVRDVLERNVVTQFRKIIFSAVVYGALVMICLGGVVWGIYYALQGVFPIHWSSNEPVLEFPVDLLFYNLLMPAAVRFFRPSSAFNEAYSWWLKRCARVLRLSHFLFNDHREDEQGHHVYRTWKAFFLRTRNNLSTPVTGEDRRLLGEERDNEPYFVRDGCYVRTPASDQVRMPRGARTFLEVDADNNRIDGRDDPDTGPHGRANDQFTKVYIPPLFRLRITTFIFLIWLFAATTGVGVTLVPLVLGRYLFRSIAPGHLEMNDIYAFSIGIYLLGGIGYLALHVRPFLARVRSAITPTPNSTTATYLQYAKAYLSLTLRLLYTYSTFLFLLSALLALIIECYIIIPLHTYFGPPHARHTIHFVQDWTLGVLYVKTLGRLILWNTPSRPATALRGIVRHGWFDPDVKLATRAFILPATVLMIIALWLPLTVGWLANATVFRESDVTVKATVYRYSYPALLAMGTLTAVSWLLRKVFEGWRARIRDEVYLIGERLHNFGEKRGVKKRVGVGRVEVAG